ncbi:MAG: archaeal proteasome endopeptidase complex subunit beta [Nitrososphaerota archaeon]|nr:archaeal proteasome endopeptidase complex subunit beta [Nitrososphaerota archaeon]
MKATTTLALKCADGVIMATDTRATMLPGFVAHKRVKKLYMVTRNIGMTIAGVPAEAINLLDILRANASIYQYQRKRIVPVRAVASLASTLLFSQRYYPYMIQVILGGYDSEGYHLFNLDPFGSTIEDNLIATGSGSPVAYGVLESGYNEKIQLKDGLELAARAIMSAMKRDVYTGDNFDIAIITEEKGFVELSEEEKKNLLKKETR